MHACKHAQAHPNKLKRSCKPLKVVSKVAHLCFISCCNVVLLHQPYHGNTKALQPCWSLCEKRATLNEWQKILTKQA